MLSVVTSASIKESGMRTAVSVRMASWRFVLCSLLWASSACGKNPRYCDPETACAYEGWICDLGGVCPASDNLTHSCIAPEDVCWDAATSQPDARPEDGGAGADGGSDDAAVLADAGPCELHEIGFADTWGAADVEVVGSRAYVADWDMGLRIIDISDPTQPNELGFFDTSGLAQGVFVAGDLAYVTDNAAGLRIADVSDPSDTSEVGYFDPIAGGSDVVVAGTRAYYVGGGGLKIVDVSNPPIPGELGSIATGAGGTDVQVIGSVAYWTSRSGGLQIVSVSNPSMPTEVGQYAPSGIDALGLAVDLSSARAYVGNADNGLTIIDISNQASPSLVMTIDTPGDAKGVAVSGGVVYVADGTSGVRMIDPVDFTHTFFDTPGTALAIQVVGDRAYVADFDAGLRIFQLCPN
jgi:hypothetical protein